MSSISHVAIRHVTVAVAQAERDRAALRWAAAEAAGRRLPLRVVHAYEWRAGPVWPARLRPMPDSLPQEARQAAAEQLAAAMGECQAAEAGLEVTGSLIEGSAADVLRDEARTAELLVLGSADRPGHGRSIGSVGQSVTERAVCPVVVVPGTGEHRRPARVVVGLDLTHSGHAALAFGLEQAQRWQAILEAVTCWQPNLLDSESLLEPVVISEKAAIEQDLCDELAPWQQKYPEVEVVATVVERRAAAGLAERAAGAGLLVLSRHGSHPVRAVLGSVHLAALRRADCPVALVPAGPAN
jgi:nucleotide-binding universal stress UspA family protein